MMGFYLALAAGTSLRATPGGYFLVSRWPLRALRVNRPLFEVLERVRDGAELSPTGDLLTLLLDLASKGYLELRSPAGPEEYPMVSIIIPVKDQPEDLAELPGFAGEPRLAAGPAGNDRRRRQLGEAGSCPRICQHPAT